MANNNGRQKGGGAAAGNSNMNEHVELTVKVSIDEFDWSYFNFQERRCKREK